MGKYVPERDRERARLYMRKYYADPVNRERLIAYRRERRKRPEVRERERERRAGYRMKQFHGLRPDDQAAMLAAQDGRCYLCGDELPAAEVVVDHDHRCCPKLHSCPDCRRGLACVSCNALIGHALDDPDRLRRIAGALEAANLSVTQRLAARPPQVTLFEVEGDSDADRVEPGTRS